MALAKKVERVKVSSEALNSVEAVQIKKISFNSPVRTYVIFVPGTTDPVNINFTKGSYATLAYWDKVKKTDNGGVIDEYEKFKSQIDELGVKYDINDIVKHFKWNGDNNEEQRINAGKDLNEFIKLKTRSGNFADVEIHLIGHSHGGNVINEFTKVAAKDPKFPKTVKIKSILYLSVPFFKNQARLNTSFLHEKCKVLNVYNDYDLTQRFVANFSMNQMPMLLKELAGKDIKGNIIGNERFYHAKEQLLTGWRIVALAAASFGITISNGIDTVTLSLTDTAKVAELASGSVLWKETISFFRDLKEVLESLLELFRMVNEQHPEFITTDIYDDLLSVLSVLIDDIDPIIDKLNKRRNNFSLLALVGDVSAGLVSLLKNINEFLKFKKNPNTNPLNSGLISLLDKIILNQIVTFDNTYSDPREIQIKGACAYFGDCVTTIDPYNNFKESAKYKEWIKEIERNEIDYENLGETGQKGPEGAAQRAEMVFKLLAQINSVYDLIDDAIEYTTYLKWFLIDKDDVVIDTLQKTLKEIRVQLRMRDRNITHAEDVAKRSDFSIKKVALKGINYLADIAVDTAEAVSEYFLGPRLTYALIQRSEKQKPKAFIDQRGSIAYLAVVSHSVSRTELREETLASWDEQFYAKGTAPSKTITL